MSGFAKHESGDLIGAIVDYSKAIEINSCYSDAYYKRGLAKAEMSDYEGALADYNEALECEEDDDNDDLYVSRGMANQALMKFEEAVEDFTAALEINKELGDAFFFRGLCYMHLDKIKEALADLKKAKKSGVAEASEFIKELSI